MKKFSIFVFLIFLLHGCDLSNPGGVLLSNQLPDSVMEYIDEKGILENEYIIAYYDVTLSLDNSESAILTNKNVIYYHESGRMKYKIPLNQIKSITHADCILALCIFITTNPNQGPVMKIEIAVLNGGDLFLDLLKEEVKKY